jgi:hypothetical protein
MYSNNQTGEPSKIYVKQEKDNEQAGPSESDSDTNPEKQQKDSQKDGKSVSPSKSDSPDKKRKLETPEEERASKHKKEKQEEERLKMQFVFNFKMGSIKIDLTILSIQYGRTRGPHVRLCRKFVRHLCLCLLRLRKFVTSSFQIESVPQIETNNFQTLTTGPCHYPGKYTGARCVRKKKKKKILYNITRGRTHLLPFF